MIRGKRQKRGTVQGKAGLCFIQEQILRTLIIRGPADKDSQKLCVTWYLCSKSPLSVSYANSLPTLEVQRSGHLAKYKPNWSLKRQPDFPVPELISYCHFCVGYSPHLLD